MKPRIIQEQLMTKHIIEELNSRGYFETEGKSLKQLTWALAALRVGEEKVSG